MTQALAGANEPGLTEQESAILQFEKAWWRYAGAKESAISELFGMTAARYYQVLNAVLDNPAALKEEPILVKRLRRMRSQRHQNRSARRLATELISS